nr:hypothetical protein [Sedimenticola selenatireducens]
MQMPHQSGLQHSLVVLLVPGIGEGHLTRWGRVADDLAVEAFDQFLLESGQSPYEAGPGPLAYQMRGFRDSCSVVTEFNAGVVRINPASTLRLVR